MTVRAAGLLEGPAAFSWCAQHGRVEEVQVLWGSWSQRPRVNRKAKKPGNRSGREAGAERSGEQNRELTNRNQIRGAGTQGERTNDREALVTKESSVDLGGGAVNDTKPYLGRSRLTSERATRR